MRYALILLALLSITPLEVTAAEYCVVTDLSGMVEVTREGSKFPVEPGDSLLQGDRITVEEGALLVLVTFHDCLEWTLGKGAFLLQDDTKPTPEEGELGTSRKFPVCYNPEDFVGAGSKEVGAYILRGDPLSSEREEYAAGNASNAIVLNLALYDLDMYGKFREEGKFEAAENYRTRGRTYFAELKKRLPGAPIVKKLAASFE